MIYRRRAGSTSAALVVFVSQRNSARRVAASADIISASPNHSIYTTVTDE
jgi:hypothetical protein